MALVGLLGGLAACEPPGPRVYVYGDSLMWEAEGYVRQWGSARGYDVVVRQQFGAAPCTLFEEMRADRRAGPAYAVIVAFSGNPEQMSGCGGPHRVSSHAYQLRQVANLWAGSGARVIWASTPRLPPTISEDVQVAMGAEARRLRLTVVDGGRYVSPNRTWARSLRCMAGEPCVGNRLDRTVPVGHNIVRANDGVHFCPGGPRGFDACPHFSSGARRFAQALMEPLPTIRR